MKNKQITKTSLVLRRYCLLLLTPWGSVLCHFLWSQWGSVQDGCANSTPASIHGGVNCHYDKPFTVWLREHWFNTLGGCPADPTVCESFVRLAQTRTFWILTYKGSFSRASRYERRHSAGQTLQFWASTLRAFLSHPLHLWRVCFQVPQTDFSIDWRDV